MLVLHRLALAVSLVLAVPAVSFTRIHAAPGDPALVICGEMGDADEATMVTIRRTYGLDRPLAEVFLTDQGTSVRGDLGTSYTQTGR